MRALGLGGGCYYFWRMLSGSGQRARVCVCARARVARVSGLQGCPQANWAVNTTGVLCVPWRAVRRFAHAQQLEAEGVSLSFYLHQGARPPARQSAELRLSRVVEERVADFEGLQVGGAGLRCGASSGATVRRWQWCWQQDIYRKALPVTCPPPTHPPIQEPTSLPPPPLPQDVRHWLQLIGHGEEAEWIDLGTVRGYKRIVFCQSVRDDVDANLGQGEWARLLPAVCEGRLVPTEWLNKVCGVVFGGGGWGGVEL